MQKTNFYTSAKVRYIVAMDDFHWFHIMTESDDNVDKKSECMMRLLSEPFSRIETKILMINYKAMRNL